MTSADAIVIGGGPAGAAAAIALAKAGAAVLVFERTRYDVERVGETLARVSGVWLRRLGVDLTGVANLASPGVVSCWERPAPVATDLLFAPDGDGWHVDRRSLDAALAKAASKAGAMVRTGLRVTVCRRVGDCWQVRAGDTEYTTPWVIDAAGRSGHLNGRRLRIDRMVAAVARLTEVTHPDRRLAVEAVPDGWWYFAPLPNARGVAVWLTDADLLPGSPVVRSDAWHRRLAATSLIAPRTTGATIGQVRVVTAGMAAAAAVVGDGWVATGDAALAPDPLSGAGVTAALTGGWHAGLAVHAALASDLSGLTRYRDWTAGTLRTFLDERAAHYDRVRKWPAAPFWARRRLAR